MRIDPIEFYEDSCHGNANSNAARLWLNHEVVNVWLVTTSARLKFKGARHDWKYNF
ncbi:protein of unknown function [Methylocella tundrae]|uniref:Uncharacterized protein n=1 Tax=Methylocella tundrae TaxID=227605 RepID=A0A4U8Z2I1_METTU|nr:protein of unknown function [Methylocella tundrae]